VARKLIDKTNAPLDDGEQGGTAVSTD
jgi:hypothetical protein